MDINDVTVVVLAFNEAPNIGRQLERLAWARSVVVVDSGSDDGTVQIARSFPNVRLFERTFDAHAAQWNYAITETGIDTGWILAMDADYMPPPGFPHALADLDDAGVTAFRADFLYAVKGHVLRGTAYPSVDVLFRRGAGVYLQDGHTQRLSLRSSAVVRALGVRLVHDDRKSLSRWVASQDRYMRLESAKLRAAPFRALSLPDKVRRVPFAAPIAMFVYCLLLKRSLLDGWAGWFYAGQRAFAELLLSLYLLDSLLSGAAAGDGAIADRAHDTRSSR